MYLNCIGFLFFQVNAQNRQLDRDMNSLKPEIIHLYKQREQHQTWLLSHGILPEDINKILVQSSQVPPILSRDPGGGGGMGFIGKLLRSKTKQLDFHTHFSVCVGILSQRRTNKWNTITSVLLTRVAEPPDFGGSGSPFFCGRLRLRLRPKKVA